MTLPDLTLPYGLRDVKITPIESDGSVDPENSVDLPAARTLNFTEAEEFESLEGDDVTVAIRGKGASINWSLEAGGISLAAREVMAGGTATASGSTPNQKIRYVKKSTDARPYFQIEGQVISDSGGDVHAIIYRAKVNGDLAGEFGNGQFFLTQASGVGIGKDDGSDDLYEIVQNESVVPIDTTSDVAPTITTTTLDTINDGVDFSQTLAATGTAPFEWEVTVGTLPAGLYLDEETGAIYGNATTPGAYSFTISATNDAGTDTQAFSGSVV